MRFAKGPALSFLLAMLAATPATAAAASLDIGAVDQVRTATKPTEPSGGGDTVQVSESGGTYAVPTGYGVITAFEHSAGTVGGTLSFKVYRPVAPARFFTVASVPRVVKADEVNLFAVRVPVQGGDRLGLSSATDTVHLAYQTFNPVDRFAFFPVDSDPRPGTTVAQDGPPAPGYRLDVVARVETDRDRDGFGDDTQDRCPANASIQAGCPGGTPLPAFSGCSAQAGNVLRGTAAGNTMTGSSRRDRIFAGAGRDTVDALGSHDCVSLGSGKDGGKGGTGNDLVRGGSGADRLAGGSGNDRLLGDSGSDRVSGERGRDALKGGPGSDRLAGGSGNDRIGARDGRRDRVSCGSGKDRVVADRIDRVSRDCERVRRLR